MGDVEETSVDHILDELWCERNKLTTELDHLRAENAELTAVIGKLGDAIGFHRVEAGSLCDCTMCKIAVPALTDFRAKGGR